MIPNYTPEDASNGQDYLRSLKTLQGALNELKKEVESSSKAYDLILHENKVRESAMQGEIRKLVARAISCGCPRNRGNKNRILTALKVIL